VKTRFLLFIVLVISIAVPLPSYEQTPVNCHFGDESTSNDKIFEKDLAVKAFTQKYPNATRYVAIEEPDPLQGELSFTIETKHAKEILLIKFNQNENGCYRPYSYHYTYNDGKIDVTIRNSLSDFTEIVNLIKTDNKKIEDFYTKNCNPIQLDYVLPGAVSKPYFCKYDINNSIEMSLQKHVGGIIEVHIPNKVMDALFYDCVLNDDFFVLNHGEEIYYDLVTENDTKIFKMDLPPGYSKMEIIITGWLADPDFCGSIWSEDSRYISPLLQTKIGVKPWMIQCNEGLNLLIKPMNTKPVCVTDPTYQELSSRGWSLTGIWNDENEELELRRIETGPANDPKESFVEKYDAVVEGSIIGCMGHKETYPIRYQCEIQVDSYIKYNGEKTGQLTALAYRDRLNEDNQKAIFGLDYHDDENYYEIIESGFTRK